jgi:hypothetical protein
MSASDKNFCQKDTDYVGEFILLVLVCFPASVIGLASGVATVEPIDILLQFSCGISIAKLTFVSKPIERSVSEITAEKEFTTTEIEAFESFRNKVASLGPKPPDSINSAETNTYPTQPNKTPARTEIVQEKYKNTVMDIPRFEEAYGETFVQHISAEFGQNVAAALLSNESFTPTIKSLLLNRSAESVAERERYIKRLEAEHRAILNWNDQLRSTEIVLDQISYDKLHLHSLKRLSELEQEVRTEIDSCQKILKERQNEIQTRGIRSDSCSNQIVFQEYVYEPLEVSYPVLSTTVSQLRTLTSRQECIVARLTR